MSLEALLERHKAFWNGTLASPLVAELPHPDWSRKPYPLSGGRSIRNPTQIRPADIDVSRLLRADTPLPDLVIDDYINGVKPAYPVAFIETVIGCPVFAAETSCFSKSPIGQSDDPLAFSADHLDQEWKSVLDDVLTAESKLAGETYPALQLHLRGIADMLAAYLGESRFCISLYDDPGMIHELGSRFADVYISIARNGIENRPAWRRGAVSHWGVYAEAPILDYQIDASSILSPDIYRRHIVELDRRVLGEFPHSVTHLHACGLHMADLIVETDEFDALEVTLERETGTWEPDMILQRCRSFLDAGKGVIINGELTHKERDWLIDSLDPGRLAIFYWLPKGSK